MKAAKHIIITISLLLSILFTLTGCDKSTDPDKIPAILFMYRSDDSNLYSPGNIEKNVTTIYSLGFYDKDGNYYFSDDPDVNALDSKTLVTEYEAGRLIEKLEYFKKCNADTLSEKYAKIKSICGKNKVEIDYPEKLPTVEDSRISWYAFYYDENGNLQYQPIHKKECGVDIYAKNDEVNNIYEWISEAFSDKERSEAE